MSILPSARQTSLVYNTVKNNGRKTDYGLRSFPILSGAHAAVQAPPAPPINVMKAPCCSPQAEDHILPHHWKAVLCITAFWPTELPQPAAAAGARCAREPNPALKNLSRPKVEWGLNPNGSSPGSAGEAAKV